MTRATPLPATSRRLLHLAATGRPRPAVDFALQLTSTGVPLDRFILDVLVPAQHENGRLWQSNRWSIAQEHAVSAVLEGVLGAVGLEAGTPAERRGTVIVTCVEEEHHTLPARMGAELLRSAGWDVTFLGGSLPVSDLREFTAEARPDAVVLSCTVPVFLHGARACIEAMADLGVPAVAAGAGFGDDPGRSARLGASGWIGPGADASAVLEESPPTAGPERPVDTEAEEIERRLPSLVQGTLDELSARLPLAAPAPPRRMAHTRDDLRDLLRTLGLALDVGETALFVDYTAWLADVLRHRQVPAVILDLTLESVGVVVERAGLPRADEVCASARELLETTPR
jgi:methanogenic corrinoid protein MtbC1